MKKLFSFLAAAFMMAACTPNAELGTPFEAGQIVTLAASMGGNEAKKMPTQQRVSGVDNGSQINLIWDEGDQITVLVGGKSSTFTLSEGAGTASATFTGEMPASGSAYSVIYPANYDDSQLATQIYQINGFSKGLMKMSTKSAGTIDGGFSLSADNALVAFQFKGEDALSRIVLTNPAASKSYTLDCAGEILTDVAKVFYFVVPAGTWSNGFSVEVYDSEHNMITSFTKEGLIEFSATCSVEMPEKEVESTQNYVGIGVFSVAADRQVTFSPGNLQYHPANNEWRFAENQWDYIGDANSNVAADYNGWIDLFGWGVGDNWTQSSTEYSDYQNFIDWGINQIGNDAPNTWRTLTKDEWDYLLYTRSDANELVGIAQVNGVNGLILLPDNWTSLDGITFKSGYHVYHGEEYYADYQAFTADQWGKFEKAGAVFLPAAGTRRGPFAGSIQYSCDYWTATKNIAKENEYKSAYYFSVSSQWGGLLDEYGFWGNSVRLVK